MRETWSAQDVFARERDLHYFAGAAAARKYYRELARKLRLPRLSPERDRQLLAAWLLGLLAGAAGALLTARYTTVPLIYRPTFFDNNSRSRTHTSNLKVSILSVVTIFSP